MLKGRIHLGHKNSWWQTRLPAAGVIAKEPTVSRELAWAPPLARVPPADGRGPEAGGLAAPAPPPAPCFGR